MGEANPKRYETTVQEDGAIIHTPVEHIEGPATKKPAEQTIIILPAEHISASDKPKATRRVAPPPPYRVPPPVRLTPPTFSSGPPRTIAVEQSLAQVPAAVTAPSTERRPNSVVASALVGVIAVVGLAAWNLNNTDQSAPKSSAMGKKAVQPEASTLDDLSTLQTSPPSPNDLPLIMPLAPEESPPASTPRKTTVPGAKLNTAKPGPLTALERVIPLSTTPAPAPTPTPSSAHNTPSPTTPESPSPAPTTPGNSSTPSPTTPESPSPAPTLELSPSDASNKLLSEFIDTARRQELLAKYPELEKYLDLKGLAINGELNSLNKYDITAHQKTLLAYSNPAVHEALGDPAWLSEDTLRTMKKAGDSPANLLVANSDNALRGAEALYQNQSTGDLAAKIPYLNDDYVQSALASLQNGESLSVPNAENAVVLNSQRAILPDGAEVVLVAVVADYTQNGKKTTMFTWKLAEPISTDKFVGVTEFKKVLETVVESTPQPTATQNGNFWSNFLSKFGNNNNNNKAVPKHGRA